MPLRFTRTSKFRYCIPTIHSEHSHHSNIPFLTFIITFLAFNNTILSIQIYHSHNSYIPFKAFIHSILICIIRLSRMLCEFYIAFIGFRPFISYHSQHSNIPFPPFIYTIPTIHSQHSHLHISAPSHAM